MSSRLHDRSHFFKYASFKTAMRVIESKSFRWSSPVKFNDPFDHQAGFVLTFMPDEFSTTLTAAIERIVFSEVIPAIVPTSLFAKLTLQLRDVRGMLTRETFLPKIHEASIECAKRLDETLIKMNAAIHEHLCHSRVLCLSELHDNVVMWSHYADEHRGVVFRLRCIDEIDNTLLAAKQVSYSYHFPTFPKVDEYCKHLIGEQLLDFAQLSFKIAYMKHIDWAYEREWRVHIALLREPPGDGYSVFQEDPRVFEAVYLGCRMEDKEVVAIAEAIKRYLPATKILRGRKSTTSFALTFDEISEV